MATVKPLINYSGVIKEAQTGDSLGVANGGTGATTLTSHGVLIGSGTSAITATSAGTSGQVLTSNGASADPTFQTLSGATVPTIVLKTASESVTSSTSLQDDDHFTFAIGASERWKGIITFPLSANNSGGFKFDITAPSGASGNCSYFGSSNNLISGYVAIGTGYGNTAGSSNLISTIVFDITNSTNAGNVTLRWAQNASFGTATTVGCGVLIAHKIS